MSVVKSLAIRGIRSFGPEDNDEQQISFDIPLTLIVGQNGCGKTTIIECLRYAVTGQMPPGSHSECFVHDPKIRRSIRGQVKLKIVNGEDKEMEVLRSMEVSLEKKFQTMESSISIVDDDGDTIDTRCADVDFLMYQEIGVSKAILNSVVFCHQEDSSWPLDEGKKVKERFDEIFNSEKYGDCLDKLRKIKKEYASSLNLIIQEVGFLTEKKQDLDNNKLKVVKTESEISEAELKVEQLTEELKPVNEKLKEIKDLMAFKFKSPEHKEDHITFSNDIRTLIFDNLQESIKNCEETLIEGKKELDEYDEKQKDLKREEDITNEKINTNGIYVNKLTLLESENQERINNKFSMIVDTAKTAEIEDITEVSNDEEAQKALEKINERIEILNKELKEQEAEADTEEKKAQAQVDESRDALTCHIQKKCSKHSEIFQNKIRLNKLQKQINSTNDYKTKLEALVQKSAEVKTEHETASIELNPEMCQNEINEDEKVVEKHEHDLEELSAKILVLQKQAGKMKEKDMVEGILKQKEKELAILMNKHKVALIEILGSVPEKDFSTSVNRFHYEIKTKVDSIKKELKEKQIESTKLQTERKNIHETLKNLRSELTKGQDEIYEVCQTQSYEDTLSKTLASVEKLQDEKNVLESSMFIFAKYKNQLEKNSYCPLCSRGFDNDSEVTDLISELHNHAMNVPTMLEKVTEKLQRSSAMKDELIGMKYLNKKLINLKEKEIPELETKLTETDTKIKTCSTIIKDLQMSLIEPEQKMQTAKLIHGGMPLLDRYQSDCKTIVKNLENLKTQCADMDTEITLDDANAKQTDLRHKLNTLRSRIKATQQKLNQYINFQILTLKKDKMKEYLLAIKKKVEDVKTLQENKKQLESDREKLLKELKELEDGLAPLQEVLESKQTAKNDVVNKYKELIEAKKNYIKNVDRSLDQVMSIEVEIKKHMEKNIPGKIEKITETIEKLEEKKKQVVANREELAKKIEELKDELSKQEVDKRDIEEKLISLDADINQGGVDEMTAIHRHMLSEKAPLIKQQKSLYAERAKYKGSLNTLKKTLKGLKAKVALALKKDIEKKYREKIYELHVTRAIDKDIKDYEKALEKCLTEFHKEKMENVNRIIREMWRKIYRGDDIEYIEIKTEVIFSLDAERRIIHNYRVVQWCKNGIEIDMRGRCSAGQKVLACLIIRLALAETFSSRFGVLALDEPTTNLDQENIKSLCSALGDIVQEKMRQNNFMFIIISHDKEFIGSLGNVAKITHYYELSKNKHGMSRIKMIDFA